MLGGAPADYDLGNERVVAKADASKSITYAQAAQKAIELGGKYSGKEVPTDINPVTKDGVAMIAGTGLIGVAKDNLPRVGVTPGLTVELCRDRARHRDRQVQDPRTCSCVADCGTVLHPQGLAHQIRGGNVMGIGMARTGATRLRPASSASRPRSCCTRPSCRVISTCRRRCGWGAVDKPDPQNPVGVERRRRAAAGLGRRPRSSPRSRTPWEDTCSIARPCRPT